MTSLALCVCVLAGLATPTAGAVSDTPVEDALRATFRITKGSTSGTGFLVRVDGESKGPRHVLVSAAHVFEDLKGNDCKLILRTAGKDNTYARREVTIPIRDGSKKLWVAHGEMDIAAMFVELPTEVDVKPFRYTQLADEKWLGERHLRVASDVCIPCFPAGVEANGAGWPILRKGSIATHPLTPVANAKTMYVDYSHFGGDSGSPVVFTQGKEPIVVGLVFAMKRQTDKATTPFEERTVHTSLGLAIAAQAVFVRETIDALLKR